MKIGVVQTKPVKGDIEANIAGHIRWIEAAVMAGADVVIFPELSLTGYEPTLAATLATLPGDGRLDAFQRISDSQNITVGAGLPTTSEGGVCISMIIFQPGKERRVYSKRYLHPDEEAFFVSGENFPVIEVHGVNIAFAICYELSVPAHPAAAAENGAMVYIASVAKFANGIDKATNTLSDIARQYSMTTLMSNCVGQSDGHACAGKTSVWNAAGKLMKQLNGTGEGLLIFDTSTGESVAHYA